MPFVNSNINTIPSYKIPKFIPSPELDLILQRATEEGFTLPDATTQSAMNELIEDMKADGFWQAEDTLLQLAYNQLVLSEFSLVNWKSPFSITNLVTFSSDWSNIGWNVGTATKTPNTVDTLAPDGTQTACKIEGATDVNGVFKTGIVSNTTVLTFSIYTKAGTSTQNTFTLRNVTTGTTFSLGQFNFTTGVITGSGWTSISVGDGWYRLIFTQSTGISVGDTMSIYYGRTGNNASINSWYVWGPQVEDRNKASRYIPTLAVPIYGNGVADTGGTMTYTPYGYEGNGVNGFVDTHFNPIQTGVNFVQNNCNVTLVNYKLAGSPYYLTGYRAVSGGFRRITNQNSVGQNLNSGNLTNPVNMLGIGLKSIYRTVNNSLNVVNQGTLVTETTPATAIPTNSSQRLLSNTTDYTNGGISFFTMGSSLTYIQIQNFRNYYNKFLTRLGLNPIT